MLHHPIGFRVTVTPLLALAAALIASLVCPLEALAGDSPHEAGLKAYWSGDFERATKELRSLEDSKGRDYVLYLMNGAAAAIAAGDYVHAERVLLAAKLTIEKGLEASEVATQVILSDEKKTYVGHQYEKVLVNFLLGLSQYMQGKYEDARIGFMEALDADTGSKEEYEGDVAYVHYMLGRTFQKLGQDDNAAVAMRNAKRHATDWRERCETDPGGYGDDQGTITIVLLNGLCPARGADAVTGAFTTIEEREYDTSTANLYLDDELAGCSSVLTDMLQQAKTSGGMTEQFTSKAGGVAAREGIGCLADAIIPGGSCITGAVLGGDEADVRYWVTAPGDVQVCEIPASAGLHTLRVEFVDAKGKCLKRYEQVWYYLKTNPGEDRTIVLRSIHNIHDQSEPSS